LNVPPMIVGPGVKTGLNIHTEFHNQLGSDIVADAVAAIEKYPLPCVVIDLGTATKFSAIDKNGAFLGVSISPGIKLSLDALSQGAAQLPHINFDLAPKSVIGTNTIDSMRSGIIFGSASMIDGMVERFKSELGDDLTVVATGGFAEDIVPHCRSKILCDRDLILEGLYTLYNKNTK